MTHAASPISLLRSMMQSVDGGIEDAIDAHGFSLSALTADEAGAVLHFTAGAWRLTMHLPPDGRSRIELRQGDAEAPGVALSLAVGDSACCDLPAALGIAMELFTAVTQS